MGHRTVVTLNNDLAHEWEYDTELGKKIFHSAASIGWGDTESHFRLPYGQIIEQVHADTQTLVVLDGYGGEAIAHTNWYRNQSADDRNLNLLREMADKMGYRLVKKSESKKK